MTAFQAQLERLRLMNNALLVRVFLMRIASRCEVEVSEQEIVTAAQAEIQALTELARDIAADRDRWRKRAELAEALLGRSKTSLAETFNDPMQDGGAA